MVTLLVNFVQLAIKRSLGLEELHVIFPPSDSLPSIEVVAVDMAATYIRNYEKRTGNPNRFVSSVFLVYISAFFEAYNVCSY